MDLQLLNAIKSQNSIFGLDGVGHLNIQGENVNAKCFFYQKCLNYWMEFTTT